MKKRKELDALLMNGKKSRPKRSKDGHELLQNMDSDTNSSDLEEFIMQPRKQTIVRRKIALYSICLRLLVFILLVGCITGTALAVWMNIQLKNDLDELRNKMIQVESLSSNSQGPPLDQSQEENLKMIPSLVTNIGLFNDSLGSLNKSLETLKADVAKMTATLNQFDSKYADLLAELDGSKTDLGSKLEQLERSVNTIKEDVATLKEQSSQPAQGPTQTPSKVTSPTDTKTEPPLDSSVAFISVRKSLETLNKSIGDLNQTVIGLQSEFSKQRGGAVPAGDSTEVLQILQKNVTYLMEVVQKELSTDEDSTEAPHGTSSGGDMLSPAANMSGWQHQMENRLNVLEVEFKQINPSDLNNNLLNNDTARGIQTILENTYKVFQDDINDKSKAWDSNQTELANRISEHSLLLTNLTIRLDRLEFQFQNISADKTSQASSAKDDNPAGDSSVHPAEPPRGTSTVKPVDNEKTSELKEDEISTSASNRPPTSPGTSISGIIKPTESSQVTALPPDSASTTMSGDTINEGVTDLENLKNTLAASTGDRSMASRSVSSLTDVMEVTGVEEKSSTDVGTSLETTKHGATTGQKLTTTPLPHLSIPGIHSLGAFQKQFPVWDVDHDEKLSYQELSRLRAFRHHPPSESRFQAYDTDTDGYLSHSEMEVALGFKNRKPHSRI